jgi:hypothetical protein
LQEHDVKAELQEQNERQPYSYNNNRVGRIKFWQRRPSHITKVGIEPAAPIGIATNKHETLSPQREPSIIARMQSTVPRQASQMNSSAEAQSAIASGFDSDASTQSIASTLSSSSRPALPIATFQIPPSHPFI